MGLSRLNAPAAPDFGDCSSSRSGWLFRSMWFLTGEDVTLWSTAMSSGPLAFPTAFLEEMVALALVAGGPDPACVTVWLDWPVSFLRGESVVALFSRRSMSVLKRRRTVIQTLQVHVCLCFGPFPLGGWMQTMHEQPGRWRGCFVVCWEGRASPSPRIARFASVSSPSEASIASPSFVLGFFAPPGPAIQQKHPL